MSEYLDGLSSNYRVTKHCRVFVKIQMMIEFSMVEERIQHCWLPVFIIAMSAAPEHSHLVDKEGQGQIPDFLATFGSQSWCV